MEGGTVSGAAELTRTLTYPCVISCHLIWVCTHYYFNHPQSCSCYCLWFKVQSLGRGRIFKMWASPGGLLVARTFWQNHFKQGLQMWAIDDRRRKYEFWPRHSSHTIKSPQTALNHVMCVWLLVSAKIIYIIYRSNIGWLLRQFRTKRGF